MLAESSVARGQEWDVQIGQNALVNGYGAGSYPGTLTTFTAITPTSTTLTLEDTAVTIAISMVDSVKSIITKALFGESFFSGTNVGETTL